MTKLVDRFLSGEAKIAYREWSPRGGEVIAWFSGDRWFAHQDDEAPETAFSEHMSPARARYIFPSDAREVAA